LNSRFSPSLIAKLTSSAFSLKDLGLNDEEIDTICGAYMKGLNAVFISFAVLIFIHLCACVFIQDYGLRRGDVERRPMSIAEESREESREDRQQLINI
jgi:hypothetical protein